MRCCANLSIIRSAFLDHAPQKTNGDVSPAALVAEKRRWIETPQTRENAKRRCRSIRGINERLQPWLADLHSQLLARRDLAVAKARRDRILHWREYAFCLYPEDAIREFFNSVLAEIV